MSEKPDSKESWLKGFFRHPLQYISDISKKE
jgi:hypothetical protein